MSRITKLYHLPQGETYLGLKLIKLKIYLPQVRIYLGLKTNIENISQVYHLSKGEIYFE